jgi:DNA-binding GntR family transcriptional regulator
MEPSAVIMSVTAQVAEAIRAEIRSGALAPSAPLSERELAAKYDVSVASVRQALLILQHAGLIRRSGRRKRAEVVNFTTVEILQRNEVRVELETLAFAKARFSTQECRELESFIDGMGADPEMEFRFHGFIWEKAGNPFLVQALVQLVGPLVVFIGLHRTAFENAAERLAAHRELLDIVRQKPSVDLVRQAISRHVHGGYDRLKDYADLRMVHAAAGERPTADWGQQERIAAET